MKIPSPSRRRSAAVSERLVHGFGRTPLGSFALAASPRGLRAILLADDEAQAREELARRLPAVGWIDATPDFTAWIDRVAGLLRQPSVAIDLPLDLRGTPFQLQVWRALAAIPPGETASYSELARAVGRPAACRAVAAACAANPLAVAIPCHRALRGDGSLSGYRWGVHRKRALLDLEAAARP